MATTTTLSQPALKINNVDYSDQCTSAVVTVAFEQLEATSFADSSRKYTAGLGNHSVTCTLMLDYGASEVEELLQALVGTTTTVVVFATSSTTAATDNPEYTFTGMYLAELTPINGELGALQTVDLTFTGGTFVRAVS
tara:strand:- start:3311 stop:3724 length:414 start_codon:yes stop_codon:yes gene_type:complete